MGKDKFSQTELLKHLADHEAKCTKCGKTALDTKLDLHHKNHDKSDDSYKNIEILCEKHHQEREGRDKRLKDFK